VAKNADGKPVVGIVYHTKVKAFVAARRKGKCMVRKAFTNQLAAEIERVVSMSAEQLDDTNKLLTDIAVKVSTKKAKERLVCDAAIKARVRSVREDALVSKRFLTDVNTYAASIVLASMGTIRGAYLETCVAGDATAKIATRKADKLEKQTAPPKEEKKDVKWEPALPREHVTVCYNIMTQNAVIYAEDFRIFTAKTTERITRYLERTVTERLQTMGITTPIQIEVVDVKR
jgi:hypothetical protein